MTDGIFETPIIELPTEELADKIAYELQSAWDCGVEWGSYEKEREINRVEVNGQNRQAIQFLKEMEQGEREAIKRRAHQRQKRIKMLKEAKRWKTVLSWKHR